MMNKTTRSKKSFIALCCVAILAACACSIPATAQNADRVVALVNGAIETVTNGRIERGTVVIRGDRISDVGADVSVPEEADVVDCSGMTIYPGMIDSETRLGLVEIGSLEETHDENEKGDLTPYAKALTAVNPNSVSIPVTRVNGITSVLTAPQGGLLPGIGAVVNLHGYTPKQMDLGGARVLALSFPSRASRGWWDERTVEKREQQWEEKMKKLNEIWDRAERYARIDSIWTAGDVRQTPEYVPAMQAMLPAVRGEMQVMVEVNRAEDIDSALAWVDRRNLKVILSGVREGWRVADRIAAAGVPCLVGPVLSIPLRMSDRYDKAYRNAALLHDAGVTIAIKTNQASNVRNLPFNAGFAAAYGLGWKEALKAVTINPARIFGVDSLVGSVEPGKLANLFVADGDPFEPKTHIHLLYIKGRDIPLTSRQTRLYDEFLDRDP